MNKRQDEGEHFLSSQFVLKFALLDRNSQCLSYRTGPVLNPLQIQTHFILLCNKVRSLPLCDNLWSLMGKLHEVTQVISEITEPRIKPEHSGPRACVLNSQFGHYTLLLSVSSSTWFTFV